MGNTILVDGIELDEAGLCSTEYLLERLLEGFDGKEILDLGCGTAFTLTNDRDSNNPFDSDNYFPDLGHWISRKGATVYGLDRGFTNKRQSYLQVFKQETGVIPVPGVIQDIDTLFTGKKFDGIFSNMVMGLPTRDVEWEEIFKSLYLITKSGGYQCHYTFEPFFVSITQKALEGIGYRVVHFFEKEFKSGWEDTLVLKKE